MARGVENLNFFLLKQSLICQIVDYLVNNLESFEDSLLIIIKTGVNICPKNLKLSIHKFGVFWGILKLSCLLHALKFFYEQESKETIVPDGEYIYTDRFQVYIRAIYPENFWGH